MTFKPHHYELAIEPVNDVVRVQATRFTVKELGNGVQIGPLAGLNVDSFDPLVAYVHRPNWLETFIGVTFEGKIRRAAERVRRNADKWLLIEMDTVKVAREMNYKYSAMRYRDEP